MIIYKETEKLGDTVSRSQRAYRTHPIAVKMQGGLGVLSNAMYSEFTYCVHACAVKTSPLKPMALKIAPTMPIDG